MVETARLEKLFKELRSLDKKKPKPPESWGAGSDNELRSECPKGCGGVVPLTHVKKAKKRGAPDIVRQNCPACGASLDDAQVFGYQSMKNWGEWIYIERDEEKRDKEAAERTAINREIGEVLGEVDPRTYGRKPEEMQIAYEILDIVSAGLGHGPENLCSARRLFLYMDSTTDYAMQWADLWIRACMAKKDYVSGANLLHELSAGEEAKYSTQFARAVALHGTFYLGHATIALLHSRDIEQALVWADRAKRACVGIPGVIEKAIGIKRIATAAKRLAHHEDLDEEEAVDEVVEALEQGLLLLNGVKMPKVDIKKLTGVSDG